MTRDAKNGVRVRIALQDITEAKRREIEIIDAKKLESTANFASGIAHDFNNLLAIIMGNIDLAQEDILAGLSVSTKLQIAKKACLNAANLTKKFLTFSSGGKPLTINISVETLINDTTSLSLADSNVRFQFSAPDNLWSVEINAGQMTQALGNVITNAREAMPQGGMVLIQADNVDSVPVKNRELPGGPNAKYVKISITDQGIGIPKNILSRVFDPYLSTKETGQEKGQGLGLTISHSIIKKHGGSIDIVSEKPFGTTVTIYLPASDKQVVAKEEAPRNVLLDNKRILVMDDEELLRDIFWRMLERLGYDVEVACHGEEAISKFSKAKEAGSPFGLVILDLTVKGGMGGAKTIHYLKEHDPDVRAIAASGYSNDPIMSNFREYGFLDAIQKPFSFRGLEESVAKIVGKAGNS